MIWLLSRLLGRLPIGCLQLFHNRRRLVAAVGGVTFANVLIFMQLGFMNAAIETGLFTHAAFDADMVLVSSDFLSLNDTKPIPSARIYQALSAPGVIDGTAIYLATAAWTESPGGSSLRLRVIGVDPDANAFEDETLNQSIRSLREPDSAIVDRQTRDLSPAIRDAISNEGSFETEINGRQIVFNDMFSIGASFETDGTLVVSDQTFFRLFPGRSRRTPSLALLQTDPSSEPAGIVAGILSLMPEGDVRAFTKQHWIDSERTYQATQKPVGFVFGFGVVLGLVVGLVIVYQVLATDVQDHLPEYATFKAIGYPTSFFLGIVFEQAAALAMLGFLPGLFISVLLYSFASNATDLPIDMPWPRPVLVFLLTVSMCVVSGAIATRRLVAADPAELF